MPNDDLGTSDDGYDTNGAQRDANFSESLKKRKKQAADRMFRRILIKRNPMNQEKPPTITVSNEVLNALQERGSLRGVW